MTEEYVKALVGSVVREVLAEGVMDRETSDITRLVFAELDKRYGLSSRTPSLGKNKSSTIQLEYWLRGGNRSVFVVVPVTAGAELSVNAGKYTVTKLSNGEYRDQVTIEVEVPRDKILVNSNSLESFYASLRNAIRHELEHAQQQTRGSTTALGISQDDWSSQSGTGSITDYYLSSDEIEAYVMQFYRAAKSQKTSFEKEANNFLKNHVAPSLVQKGVPQPQRNHLILKIKKAWIEYAKKRLPNLFTDQ
jgi:hypothetical protein